MGLCNRTQGALLLPLPPRQLYRLEEEDVGIWVQRFTVRVGLGYFCCMWLTELVIMFEEDRICLNSRSWNFQKPMISLTSRPGWEN